MTHQRSRTVRDAYAVLGVARAATHAEIRSAWRRAARATHPDLGGDVEAFHVVAAAYEILSDPRLRRAHDLLLDARAVARRAREGADGGPSGGTGFGFGFGGVA